MQLCGKPLVGLKGNGVYLELVDSAKEEGSPRKEGEYIIVIPDSGNDTPTNKDVSNYEGLKDSSRDTSPAGVYDALN